jgi:hypothetical protein
MVRPSRPGAQASAAQLFIRKSSEMGVHMKRAIFGLCAAAGLVAATKSQWLGQTLAVRAQASVTPGNIRYAVQIAWDSCGSGSNCTNACGLGPQNTWYIWDVPAGDSLGRTWYETALGAQLNGKQVWIEGNGDCTDPFGAEGVSFIQVGYKP